MAPQLGWIGLGNMGRGMCKNLIEKGSLTNPLLIYNRTTSKAEKLSEELGHSTVVSSPASLVQKSDIIFYCLGEDKSVLDMVESILAEVKDVKGKVFVDCSTILPESTEKESEMVLKAGGEFVACPVFGAPPMAMAGQLVCVLAGRAESVEKVKPFCKGVMGRANIDYSGKPPGQATLLKIIGNTFILSMVENLSEGHVLAEKSGLGGEELHSWIETMFPGPYTAYSRQLLDGVYYKAPEPAFAVALARKDAGHAMSLAKDAGMRMKNVELADGYLEQAQSQIGERSSIIGMYGAKRVESGLDFENGS